MKKKKTKEVQNQIQYDMYSENGGYQLGPWTTHIMRTDPKHIGFILARYKFVAKMLSGKQKVLEVGCGDAFGTRIVLQEVGFINAIDFEPLVLEDARKRFLKEGITNCEFSVLNIIEQTIEQKFDAAYSLDVIEHIEKEKEHKYFENICNSLTPDGVFIMGTPNITASKYASVASIEGHINLKSASEMKKTMSEYFSNVFVFSMNDEVVHTGYFPMAHYLFAVGAGVKTK